MTTVTIIFNQDITITKDTKISITYDNECVYNQKIKKHDGFVLPKKLVLSPKYRPEFCPKIKIIVDDSTKCSGTLPLDNSNRVLVPIDPCVIYEDKFSTVYLHEIIIECKIIFPTPNQTTNMSELTWFKVGSCSGVQCISKYINNHNKIIIQNALKTGEKYVDYVEIYQIIEGHLFSPVVWVRTVRKNINEFNNA